MINLRIDDTPVQAEQGQTILAAARDVGIGIPTLFHVEALSPVGACRLCLVEIRNWNGRLVPACATLAQEGLDVVAHSEKLTLLRRTILELLFAERNHICAFCVSSGHCELQTLAAEMGMDHVTFPYRFPALSVDATHPKFGIDHNRCVLCGRCVRACYEVEGACTWGFSGRGVATLVEADLGDPWGSSKTCTACGKCVQACPVGALFEKGRATAEQVKRPEVLAEVTERRPRA